MNNKSAGIGGTLPKTFAERGYSIPFNTNLLSFTRLRVSGENGVEALLPGLSGAKGTYIVPWNTLPELVSFSLHDRKLFKAVCELETYSPITIRAAVFLIQKDGYDGPDLAEKAKKSYEKSHEISLMTNFTLIGEAVRQVGGGEVFSPTDLIDEENMRRARNGLKSYAEKMEINAQDLLDILAGWAEIISPVGSPNGEFSGFLTETIMRMVQTSVELIDWAEDEPPEVAMLAHQISDMTAMTGRMAYEEISKLHQLAASMSIVLSQWESNRKKLIEKVSLISNILDGWEVILDKWTHIQKKQGQQRRKAIAELVQYLPTLPSEILNETQKTIWNSLSNQQKNIADDNSISDDNN